MSESKLESFQNKCRLTGEVIVVGPLAQGLVLPTRPSALLAVDGGADHLSFFDLSIGDGDSSALEMDIVASIHKDQNDLALALELIPREVKVTLFGFWGQRLDHQLTVLGEIALWNKERRQPVTLFGNLNERLECLSEGIHALHHYGLFSLLSLYEGEFRVSGGINYPLAKKRLPPLSSHLLSNQARGDFEVESSVSFFVYFAGSP